MAEIVPFPSSKRLAPAEAAIAPPAASMTIAPSITPSPTCRHRMMSAALRLALRNAAEDIWTTTVGLLSLMPFVMAAVFALIGHLVHGALQMDLAVLLVKIGACTGGGLWFVFFACEFCIAMVDRAFAGPWDHN